MPTIPWKTFGAVEPEREYFAMASRLPLRSAWRIPMFMRLTMVVRGQLARSEGLAGYSLVADLRHKEFLTLSAWTDEAHLDSFAKAVPHTDVMRKLRPHVGATKFVTWHVAGTALPVSWEEGRKNLAAPATDGPPPGAE